jgi:hypothetical protein
MTDAYWIATWLSDCNKSKETGVIESDIIKRILEEYPPRAAQVSGGKRLRSSSGRDEYPSLLGLEDAAEVGPGN